MTATRERQLRALKVQLIVAVAALLLVAWAAIAWLGWWALVPLASFTAVFTMKQATQLAAARAAIAEATRGWSPLREEVQ